MTQESRLDASLWKFLPLEGPRTRLYQQNFWLENSSLGAQSRELSSTGPPGWAQEGAEAAFTPTRPACLLPSPCQLRPKQFPPSCSAVPTAASISAPLGLDPLRPLPEGPSWLRQAAFSSSGQNCISCFHVPIVPACAD